jgi:signal transduction histidine kinase
MNRLWVRISLVIGCIAIFIVILPILTRELRPRPEPGPFPALERFTPEQVERLRENFAERERQYWLEVFRTILVGALLGLAAGVLVSRWLVAPLRKLEQGAEAISEGRLEVRVPLQGSQEIQSAAKAFNQMAEELSNAETLRRNLLADVTHELRHPLHILQGNLQAILDGVYPLEMEEIASLSDQTHHLTALVNDLHELAQAEAHQLSLHKQETDLATLVNNLVEAFQPVAANKEIRLQADLRVQPITRVVDADRIRQALANLVGNALRYTPQGGEVGVVLDCRDGVASIRVQDTGIGISPEELPHVFDRFYRADSSRNRDIPGTGLGLAIAQALIQAHGGRIEAASPARSVNAGQDAPQGSAFTIFLPNE